MSDILKSVLLINKMRRATPRTNFYDWSLRTTKDSRLLPGTIESGESLANMMTKVQSHVYDQVASMDVDKKSPFSITCHSHMRATSDLGSHSYVHQLLAKIDTMEVDGIPDMLSRLHSHGCKTLFTVEYEPDLEEPVVDITYFRLADPVYPNPKYVEALGKCFGIKFDHDPGKFELVLTKQLPPRIEWQSPRLSYNPMNDMGLVGDLIWIKWYLLAYTQYKHFAIEKFSVDNIRFFKSLGELQTAINLPKWKDYLRFQLLHRLSGLFTNTWLLEHVADRKQYGRRGVPLLKHHCAELAAKAWWQDAGKMLVRSNKEHYTKARRLAEYIAEDVKDALERLVKASRLRDDTKANILSKLDGMVHVIGWSDVDESVHPPYLHVEDAFDVQVITGSKYQYSLSNYGLPTNPYKWRWVPGTEVNAFYSRESNVLYIPVALLNEPFIYLSPDKIPENYAAIGSIIAHEIYHGFDYDSKHVDADGYLSSWWADRDEERFKCNTEKLIKVFEHRSSVTHNLHINGRQTLSENIADLIALDMCWLAFVYRTGVTCDRRPSKEEIDRFFIMFSLSQAQVATKEVEAMMLQSDNHAPAIARVNLPLGMFKPYLDQYCVKSTDPMFVPIDKRPEFIPM